MLLENRLLGNFRVFLEIRFQTSESDSFVVEMLPMGQILPFATTDDRQ